MPKKEKKPIKVNVTFTPGYEQRFTKAVIKLYENRLKKIARENNVTLEEAQRLMGEELDRQSAERKREQLIKGSE